ncbi:predicted protein [Botrytis cinerea T4]|uniref:Uncharacterized protein n=1 Tax=Botryotinia fuckeliana (strain T4) TaxID=999810 RepID=G2YH91_BOTF4|nr:predicted protein [Botrytis cinerea T4]
MYRHACGTPNQASAVLSRPRIASFRYPFQGLIQL